MRVSKSTGSLKLRSIYSIKAMGVIFIVPVCQSCQANICINSSLNLMRDHKDAQKTYHHA